MQATQLCSRHAQAVRGQPWRPAAAAHQGRRALHLGRPGLAHHRLLHNPWHVANATDSTGAPAPEPEAEDEEMGVLLPEEDWVVPGTYEDAMKAGTKLGKAVQGACDELATLGELENEVLSQAQELLQQVGYKGSLFTAPAAQQQQQAADDSASQS